MVIISEVFKVSRSIVFFNPFLGASWALFGSFGARLGPLGVILAGQKNRFSRYRLRMRSWASLGGFLGPFRGPLGASCRPLGGHFPALWGVLVRPGWRTPRRLGDVTPSSTEQHEHTHNTHIHARRGQPFFTYPLSRVTTEQVTERRWSAFPETKNPELI